MRQYKETPRPAGVYRVHSVTLFHDGARWWIMGWMFDASVE